MCWKSGVHARVLGVLGDVEAVVDVAVRRVPERGQQRDRLARGLERDRLVQQERAARRVDDGGALVADDEVGDARLLEVRAAPSGTSGPSPRPPGSRLPASGRSRRACAAAGARRGRRACGRSRRRRPGRRAGRSGGRISRRSTASTYAATSAICWSVSWPANGGIAPWPFVTRVTTSSVSGLASSRFGPTVPVAPASASVWQPPQPALVKTALPAVGVARELEGRKVARVRSSPSAACRRPCRPWRSSRSPSRQPAPSRPSASASRTRATTMCPAHHGGSLTRRRGSCVGCTHDRRPVDARAVAVERLRRRRRARRHRRVRRQRRAARPAARARRAREPDADASPAHAHAPRSHRARGRALRALRDPGRDRRPRHRRPHGPRDRAARATPTTASRSSSTTRSASAATSCSRTRSAAGRPTSAARR